MLSAIRNAPYRRLLHAGLVALCAPLWLLPAPADARFNVLDTSASYTPHLWGLERTWETECRDSQGCFSVSISTADAPGATHGATLTVSNSTDLQAALETSSPGSTIHLLAGNYGTLSLQNMSTDLRLVADPDAPAVLNGLDLKRVSGLELDGIVFDFVQTEGLKAHAQPFSIDASENIVIRNALFDGDNAFGTGTSADGYGTGTGLAILNSSDIAVIDSEITGFMKGLKLGSSNNVVLSGNEFHSMRSDALSMGSITNVLIENNYFHDRNPAPDTEDHADFIQLMSKNADIASSGLVVRGNLFDIGDGGKSQSLFLNNRAVQNGAGEDMFYRDFLIEDNVIINGQVNGIVIGATDGLIVRNNTVLHASPLDGDTTTAPVIKISEDSTNVVIADNVTGGLRGPEGQADWMVTGNVIVQNDSPALENYYGDLFIDPTGHLGGNPSKLMLLPDSPLALSGAGAASMIYMETPGTLTPIVQTESQPGNRASWVLDAGMTAGPDGLVGLDSAQFSWVFSDGVSAEGQKILRVFTEPGIYTATLTVTHANGQVAVSKTAIQVNGPDILGFDPETGQIFAHAYGLDEALTDSLLGSAQAPQSTTAAPSTSQENLLDLSMLDSALSLSGDLLDPIYQNGQMEIALRFAAQPGRAADGEIMRLHGAFNVRMQDGTLEFSLTDTDGKTTVLTSQGGLLGDGWWHDVILRHDAHAGTLGLWVDGTLQASATDIGNMAVTTRDLTLGGAFGREAFEAWVSVFDLRTSQDSYAFSSVPEIQVLNPASTLPDTDQGEVLPLDSTPGAAQILKTMLALDTLLDDDTSTDAFAAAYLDAGRTVTTGEESGSVLRAADTGAFLLGDAGNDRLRAGSGNDVLQGGDGADQFIFDLRNGTSAGGNVVLDLSFAEGDSLRILDTAQSLWLRNEADIVTALEQGVLDITAQDGALRLSLPGGTTDILLLSYEFDTPWESWA